MNPNNLTIKVLRLKSLKSKYKKGVENYSLKKLLLTLIQNPKTS
jgi:hypothetical protein